MLTRECRFCVFYCGKRENGVTCVRAAHSSVLWSGLLGGDGVLLVLVLLLPLLHLLGLLPLNLQQRLCDDGLFGSISPAGHFGLGLLGLLQGLLLLQLQELLLLLPLLPHVKGNQCEHGAAAVPHKPSARKWKLKKTEASTTTKAPNQYIF